MKNKSVLIIAILLMAIGFAAISTTLIINGNAKVSENESDFSVIFTAANLDGNNVYNSVIDDTKKIINFTTSELKWLHQTSILTYEVTNNSSNYDAEVSVTCVPKDGTTAKYTSIKNKLENDATKVLAKSSVNGTLTVTLDKVTTENVTEEYTCKLEFNAVERDTIGVENQFQKDSWATIAANVKAGNTNKYNVGDTKKVDLGDLGTHYVRIANMSACTTETSETACGFVVEFADIITTQKFIVDFTSIGGWENSNARTYISGTLFNSLPTDLQSVITSTKVISSHGNNSGETNFETQDKLYLLSSEEIYGDFASSSSSQSDTSVGTSKQLDYYKNLGVTTSNYADAIKQYNVSKTKWWLRSVSFSKDYNGLVVSTNGSHSSSSVPSTGGISPAFRIA